MKRRLEEVALSAPGRERADTQMFGSQLSLEYSYRPRRSRDLFVGERRNHRVCSETRT
jgi:hypothetical protein